MIRKPDAKNRAELLLSELSNDGFTLKRGRALDIVAKLEGCRDWNTFCAAAPENQQAAGTGPEYAVGSLVKAAQFGRVDSVCLAALLQHSGHEDSTVLYRWESPEGKKFELRLSGTALFGLTEPETGHLVYHSSANGLTPEFVQAWERSRQQANPEFLRRPCLQWFNEEGRLVVDLFVPLSVNVMDAVHEFQQLMTRRTVSDNQFLVDAHTTGIPVQTVAQEESTVSPQYTVGDIARIAKDGYVSDLDMAAHLRHAHQDDNTQLLSWTSPAGEEYALRLCGCVRFESMDRDGNPRLYSSADGLTQDFLDAVSAFYEHGGEFLDSPFYEWVHESGDPVGGVFEALSIAVQDEVADLKRMLAGS